jgi:hypothetical protein
LLDLFVARDVLGAVSSVPGVASQGLSKVPFMPSRAWVRLGLGLGFARLLVFFFWGAGLAFGVSGLVLRLRRLNLCKLDMLCQLLLVLSYYSLLTGATLRNYAVKAKGTQQKRARVYMRFLSCSYIHELFAYTWTASLLLSPLFFPLFIRHLTTCSYPPLSLASVFVYFPPICLSSACHCCSLSLIGLIACATDCAAYHAAATRSDSRHVSTP